MQYAQNRIKIKSIFYQLLSEHCANISGKLFRQSHLIDGNLFPSNTRDTLEDVAADSTTIRRFMYAHNDNVFQELYTVVPI